MKTISQRELRNDNAEVIRGVERGETYVVTRRGVPVALLSPVSSETDLHCIRPATKRRAYTRADRVRWAGDSPALLDDLRGQR
ncbi:type II toxin-antitoxin system prevent-host-death family antitoxin [Skermania sp. ID1734]|uniref:type II toxin-antitoxin system Phd/YefM family antitoxin n=1 Tax=Skermania sp. ID1734 TaxID=2597516 RepID=UPI00118054BE|nr:type II toxin-antitoxin system prevent-host-death family antitoxin [Skermania sp. ID1734]TSD96098.1 type II toxin-antitoxin system prevent-host-death family antitoxin [Skermania sp. ID1734]